MKTIFTGFSPNLTTSQVREALLWLLYPLRWLKWQRGDAVNRVEMWLRGYFGIPHAYTFDSGRSALFFALQAIDIQQGDEVLVQGYTCMVVSNAIIWAGGKPVYVDIGSDLNMDVQNLAKKITPHSKVIVIQHTFGQPADLGPILELAKKHNLRIIEDCAHSLGAKYKGTLTGTLGDIGMLSFGGDKVVSCGRGGALITKDAFLAKRIEKFQKNLKPLSNFIIFQHLIHYPIFFLGKKYYTFGVGKWLLALTKKFHITHRIIETKEKQGKPISYAPSQLPNALASLLLIEFKSLVSLNRRRKEIALLYNTLLPTSIKRQTTTDDSIFLRYALFVPNPKKIMDFAKQRHILLGDWYNQVIAPSDASLTAANYQKGECPQAEVHAAQSINLPTHRDLTEMDVKRIVTSIKEFYDDKRHG